MMILIQQTLRSRADFAVFQPKHLDTKVVCITMGRSQFHILSMTNPKPRVLRADFKIARQLETGERGERKSDSSSLSRLAGSMSDLAG